MIEIIRYIDSIILDPCLSDEVKKETLVSCAKKCLIKIKEYSEIKEYIGQMKDLLLVLEYIINNL